MRTFCELTMRKPQASLHRPDWPAQEVAKLGSVRAELTVKGAGAPGFG
jgi:hypothetical protein